MKRLLVIAVTLSVGSLGTFLTHRFSWAFDIMAFVATLLLLLSVVRKEKLVSRK
jgi:hypothetical protein